MTLMVQVLLKRNDHILACGAAVNVNTARHNAPKIKHRFLARLPLN